MLPFLAIGWTARPDFKALAAELIDLPLGDHEFIYMVAAIIGMTFNPWMVFYQQSAIAEKKVRPGEYQVARWDTAAGAVLTQLFSAAVLIAMAATRFSGTPANLSSIGEISGALSSVLGDSAGRIVFGVGVWTHCFRCGCTWGFTCGCPRLLACACLGTRQHSRLTKWFYWVFAFSVMSAAALVWSVRNLVWLNITAQVINAVMLPMVIGFLLALAADAVPEPKRVQGRYLQLIIALSVAISSIGLFAAIVEL
jgi:Mn2+/Fe2+ NRAMP family transporter